MIPKLGLDGTVDDVEIIVEHHLVELLDHGPASELPQRSAGAARRTFAVQLGEFGEFDGRIIDLGLHLLQPTLGVGRERQQDVRGRGPVGEALEPIEQAHVEGRRTSCASRSHRRRAEGRAERIVAADCGQEEEESDKVGEERAHGQQ